MVKVVLNSCHGGFNVSEEVVLWMRQYEDEEAMKIVLLGETYYPHNVTNTYHSNYFQITRTNPLLVEFIETYGSERASGMCANLRIEEVDNLDNYSIEEFAGYEKLIDLYDENIDWENLHSVDE